MKIVHLLQSTKYSGAESVVCQIIQMAPLISDEIEMIYVSPRGPIENILKEKKIRYFLLDSFSQHEIDRAIKELKPDLIQAHDFSASVKVAKYKNVISHLHNNASWLSKIDFRTIVYALCISRFKYIIGVSDSIRKEFLFNKFLGKKYVTLPNIVDDEKVLRMAEEGDRRKFDLLYVGRFAEAKNPLRFLRIVKSVVDNGINVKAVMLGQGPLFESCEEYIKTNNLTEHVDLQGFTSNPYCFMKNAKMLVMTSVYEGFGLVAVESMILGTPVLCTPVGGLVNIVDESCGALCESDNDFVDAIRKMYADNELLIQKSISCKNNAKRFCNKANYISVLKRIYFE